MIKKYLLGGIIVLLLLQVTSVSAQIQKGDWIVRGGFSASTSKSNERNSRDLNASLSSNIGYFVRDGLRLVLSVGARMSRTKEDGEMESKDKQMHIGPAVSYYLLLSDEVYWVNNLNYTTVVFKSEYRRGTGNELSAFNSSHATVSASTGVGYFLNSNWSVEGILNAGLVDSGSFIEGLILYTNIGFRYFISNKKSKKKTD